jgi:Domain of unknown function (DUF1772)
LSAEAHPQDLLNHGVQGLYKPVKEIMIAGNLALTAAAMFAGVAFYVSFAEQAARLTLDDRALLAEWKPSYKRGFAIQAPLAIVGGILGLVAWWSTGRSLFVIGAILLLANWPWTIFGILPTNNVLMATRLDDANAKTRDLIVRWNVLHSVRTVLGGLATLAFLIALSSV